MQMYPALLRGSLEGVPQMIHRQLQPQRISVLCVEATWSSLLERPFNRRETYHEQSGPLTVSLTLDLC